MIPEPTRTMNWKNAWLALNAVQHTLSGRSDETFRWLPWTSWLWGLWWLVLIGITLVFNGQSSKFIYIDF